MAGAWGGYSNGQIPLSAMRQIQGEWFEPSMANAMDQLLSQAAANGVNIHINEGYRPLGEPGDQYVTNESQTSMGRSTQWFQWGRYLRGETPSAGTPGTSSHGWGMAADINPGRNNSVVANIASSLGLSFTVPSESWHLAIGGGGGSSYNQNGAEIQSLLNNFGYGLVVDGIVGPKTLAAIKDFQAKHGLVVDGIVGPKTMAALKGGSAPAPAPSGNRKIKVDGVFGPETTRAMQNILGVTADGQFGPITKRALQSYLGVAADGEIGPITVRALQAKVGATQDGDWGPQTTRALQNALNAGTF